MRVKVSVVFLSLLIVSALGAAADDGSTPIPFTDPYVTPQVISSPGSYVVTRNLTPAGGGPIILVDCGAMAAPTNVVYIDLNGFVISQPIGGVDPVILVAPSPTCEVIIRNGDIIGGFNGIRVDPPSRKLVVEDVEIKETSDNAILSFDLQNFALRRNTFNSIGGAAIQVVGAMTKTGVIEDNVIYRAAEGIMVDFASAVEISNNRLQEIFGGAFGGYGIRIVANESCLITQNTVESVSQTAPAGGVGIYLEQSSCKIHNNVVSRTQGDGILLTPGSDDSLVLDNKVREASRDGIRIDSGRNHVEGNVTNFNGFHGLHLFGPGAFTNTINRNTSLANGFAGPAACGPPITFPDFCDDTGSFVSHGNNNFVGFLF